MLAHHPTTGQPIRIIKTDVQISRDSRTLVWVKSTFQKSAKWGSRWSAVISDASAFEILDGELPIAVILSECTPEWIQVLKQLDEKNAEVLLITTEVAAKQLEAKGLSWSQHLQFADLYDMYPYISGKVADSDPIEKVVVSLAHVLRFQKIAWTSSPHVDSISVRYQIRAWKSQCQGNFIELESNAQADEVIPQIWLIQQYFKHPLPRRAREIWSCLEKNLACKYIDKLLLLNETDGMELPHSDKLLTRVIGTRLTYAEVFRAIQTDVPKNAIVVFSNSDIYFDDTLRLTWSIDFESRSLFLALLRWEENGALFGPRADSQDSWIVAKNSVTFEVKDDEFGFPFGKPGCDNAISLAMLRKKFIVANPAYSIKTHHVHSSQIRNYDPHDVLYKPMFLYVEPTALQVASVHNNLKKYREAVPDFIQSAWKDRQLVKESFPRMIKEIKDGQGKTICTMINRREEECYDPYGKNMYTPSPEPLALYRFFQPMLVTNTGLLADMTSIYVGSHKEWSAGWETAEVSSLTPAIHIPIFITTTTPASCWTDLSEWVLQSFLHVYRIRSAIKHSGRQILPEFAVPSLPQISDFLYDCVWNESKISTAPWIENTQYYCNEVWTSSPVPDKITKEDVTLLRSILAPSILRNKRKPVCVFCIGNDQSILTKGWVEETIQNIFRTKQQEEWDFRILTKETEFPLLRQAFQDADWIVGEGSNSLLNWIWMATPGTHVLEFQRDMEISGKRVHLAGASSLNYVGGIIHKEAIEFQRQHAMLDFGLALQKYGFKHVLSTLTKAEDLPVIVLPEGKALEGIWSHCGDTFREMVKVWAERGYCKIQTTEDSPHCWWGSIGEVLLYDRPTPRWWQTEHLPSYQMALFGNCPPPGPASHVLRQSVWSFWPRSPRMLEEKVENGIPGWGERTRQSIFLGKVENGVQKQRRCNTDWSKCVELFSMPIDSTGKYPYTQSEYLDLVMGSRFGLCLPGYGNKCNREIEYMGLGTVPIVTEGVDMKHYLRAPKEGTHYFTAKTPADVERIVQTTTQETWEKMSYACKQWWRENASAEGLFRLTAARIEQCRPYLTVGIPPTL